MKSQKGSLVNHGIKSWLCVAIFSICVHLVTAQSTYFADCINFFSDERCTIRRQSATVGRRLQTTYCLRSDQHCSLAPDFQEAYQFQCSKENTSFVGIWRRARQCSGLTTVNVSAVNGECTFAFVDSANSVYLTLECNTQVFESETLTFLSSFALSISLAVIMLLLFCCLRTRLPHLYETRATEVENERNLAADKKPSPYFFGWIMTTIKLTDNEIFEQCGMDALMYTLLFRSLLFAFGVCFIPTMAIIIPVNMNGGVGQAGIDRLSVANVTDGSSGLNAHFLLTILYSVAVMTSLRYAYRKYSKFRHRYLTKAHPNNFTVLVRDIPDDVPDEASVTEYFKKMYSEADAATRVRNVTALTKMSAARKKVKKNLERAQYRESRGKFPTVRKDGILCFGGEVVNAVMYWRDKLDALNIKFGRNLEEVNRKPDYLPSAIVSFRSIKTATIASQLVHSPTPFTWSTSACPQAKDLLWSNLSLTYRARMIRSTVVTIATIILMLLWAIPVSFVISLFSIGSLSRLIPQLDGYHHNNSFTSGLVQGFLASTILLGIMALVPYLMRWLSWFQGYPTKSDVGHATVVKLFWFQVINVFLVSLVFGSVLPIIDDLRDNPSALIDLLGSSIPRTGLFFTSLVMVRATPVERRKAFSAIHFDIPVYISGMTYSNINPVILPFFLGYLVLGYVTNRYLLFYVYKQRYDSGGQLWPLVFQQLMSCLIISQVAIAAVLIVKGLPVQATMLILLIGATSVFWYFTNVAQQQSTRDLALEVAVDLNTPLPDGLLNEYMQPELKEEEFLTADINIGRDFKSVHRKNQTKNTPPDGWHRRDVKGGVPLLTNPHEEENIALTHDAYPLYTNR
eukprot:gene9382-1630_t